MTLWDTLLAQVWTYDYTRCILGKMSEAKTHPGLSAVVVQMWHGNRTRTLAKTEDIDKKRIDKYDVDRQVKRIFIFTVKMKC